MDAVDDSGDSVGASLLDLVKDPSDKASGCACATSDVAKDLVKSTSLERVSA